MKIVREGKAFLGMFKYSGGEPGAHSHRWLRIGPDGRETSLAERVGPTSAYSPMAVDVGCRLRYAVRPMRNDGLLGAWTTSPSTPAIEAAWTERTFYELLEVEERCDFADIEEAFTRCTAKYSAQPGCDPADANAEILLEECTTAYEVLSGANSRALYGEDKAGMAVCSGQPEPLRRLKAWFRTYFGNGAFDDTFGGFACLLTSEPAFVSKTTDQKAAFFAGRKDPFVAILREKLPLNSRDPHRLDADLELKLAAPLGPDLLMTVGNSYIAEAQAHRSSAVMAVGARMINYLRRPLTKPDQAGERTMRLAGIAHVSESDAAIGAVMGSALDDLKRTGMVEVDFLARDTARACLMGAGKDDVRALKGLGRRYLKAGQERQESVFLQEDVARGIRVNEERNRRAGGGGGGRTGAHAPIASSAQGDEPDSAS